MLAGTYTLYMTQTLTVQIDHPRVTERDIYAAVDTARAAGCTHYQIEAPRPQLYGQPPAVGTWIAARGAVAQPMRTTAQAEAISGPERGEW